MLELARPRAYTETIAAELMAMMLPDSRPLRALEEEAAGTPALFFFGRGPLDGIRTSLHSPALLAPGYDGARN